MNPFLQELGFSKHDRVVVVHADDIGLCHSTVPALEELLHVGTVTSASAMVPCCAFQAVVEWRHRHPDVDLGVHLTLTSEWDNHRWGPVSDESREGGLVDEHGFFHRTRNEVRTQAEPDAVRAEILAQTLRAEQLGLAPSHIDSHMLVCLSEEFHKDYVQLGCERSLPVFFPRLIGRSVSKRPAEEKRARYCEMQGQPVFDHFAVATRPANNDPHAFVRHIFQELPSGLSSVLLHPLIESAEARSITDQWPSRVADFEVFRNPGLRKHIQDLGIHLISYQPLRDIMSRGT